MDEKINYIIGMRPVMEAVMAGKKIDKVFLKSGMGGDLFAELVALLREHNIAFQFVPVQRLEKISHGRHQGVIAQLSSIDYVPLEEAVENAFKSGDAPVFVLLDGISDVRNLGAIARSAECAKASAIVVPARGGALVTPDSVKASAGALVRMNISKVSNLKEAIYYLKDAGFKVVAATEKGDEMIYNVDFRGATAIVMGSEGKGISPAVLALCDVRCRIPMLGEIGSLNVSVATSIVLFEAVRQRILA